jgi:hypothetical protein
MQLHENTSDGPYHEDRKIRYPSPQDTRCTSPAVALIQPGPTKPRIPSIWFRVAGLVAFVVVKLLGVRRRAKRHKIWELRRVMAARREELRSLRREKDLADNGFMQAVRERLITEGEYVILPVKEIQQHFERMQAARNVYCSAELAYEAMEQELETEEQELTRMETSLPALHGDPLARHPTAVQDDNSLNDQAQEENSSAKDQSSLRTPDILLGISAELEDDIHPLYGQLLDAAAKLNSAEDFCEEIEVDRERLLSDLERQFLLQKHLTGDNVTDDDLKSFRSSLVNIPDTMKEFEARFGLSITQGDYEFLRDYESLAKEAREKVDQASRRLTYLRELCMSKGVMRKHPTFQEEVAIFSNVPDWSPHPDDGMIDIGPTHHLLHSHLQRAQPAHDPFKTSPGSVKPSALAHPLFSILMSNPTYILQLLSPIKALARVLALPKTDPTTVQLRAECMKEIGILKLMKASVKNKVDFVNQWLMHRVRTCRLECMVLLATTQLVFQKASRRLTNLRRWQEEVLYWWPKDGAAHGSYWDEWHGSLPVSSNSQEQSVKSCMENNSVGMPEKDKRTDDGTITYDSPLSSFMALSSAIQVERTEERADDVPTAIPSPTDPNRSGDRRVADNSSPSSVMASPITIREEQTNVSTEHALTSGHTHHNDNDRNVTNSSPASSVKPPHPVIQDEERTEITAQHVETPAAAVGNLQNELSGTENGYSDVGSSIKKTNPDADQHQGIAGRHGQHKPPPDFHLRKLWRSVVRIVRSAFQN